MDWYVIYVLIGLTGALLVLGYSIGRDKVKDYPPLHVTAFRFGLLILLWPVFLLITVGMLIAKLETGD